MLLRGLDRFSVLVAVNLSLQVWDGHVTYVCYAAEEENGSANVWRVTGLPLSQCVARAQLPSLSQPRETHSSTFASNPPHA